MDSLQKVYAHICSIIWYESSHFNFHQNLLCESVYFTQLYRNWWELMAPAELIWWSILSGNFIILSIYDFLHFGSINVVLSKTSPEADILPSPNQTRWGNTHKTFHICQFRGIEIITRVCHNQLKTFLGRNSDRNATLTGDEQLLLLFLKLIQDIF